MAAADSAMQGFADIVVDAAEWIARLLGDDVAREAFLREIGATPQPASVEEGDVIDATSASVSAAKSYVDLPSDQADAAATEAAVVSIIQLVDVIAGVVETVTADLPPGRTAAEVVGLLIELAAVERLRARHPTVFAVARALSIVSEPLQPFDFAAIDFAALWEAVTNPIDAIKSISAEDLARFMHLLIAGIAALAVKYEDPDGGDRVIDFVFGWDPDPTLSPRPLSEDIASRTLSLSYGSESRATVSLVVVPDGDGGPGMIIGAGGQVSIDPFEDGPQIDITAGVGGWIFVPLSLDLGAEAGGPEAIEIALTGPARGEPILVPASKPFHVVIGRMSYGIAFQSDGMRLRFAFEESELVFSTEEADAFVGAALRQPVWRMPFDVAIGYDSTSGFFFEGGTGLQTALPVNRTVIGVRVDTIYLALRTQRGSGAASLELSAAMGLDFGRFQASVDRIGVDLTFDGGFSAGALDVGFKRPAGIGFTLAFSGARGGGYLSFDVGRGEYSGSIDVDFCSVSLKAMVVLTTKGITAWPKWALLVVFSFERRKQHLGGGYFLRAVGGIVGMHHSVSIDKLRAGLQTKALDDVLFPDNPVADAPRIVNTLRTVFPVTSGTVVAGPVIQVDYGTPVLAKYRVGLVAQWTGELLPDRLVVLGQAKIALPTEHLPIVKLNADFVGVIDFSDSGVKLAVDARLFDSKVAEFTVQGSWSARLVIGTNPDFIVTAGGFHPEYPVRDEWGFPKLDRLKIGMKKGIARMTLAGYMAVTSNTLQAGAHVDLVAKKYGFSAEAGLSFDAMIIIDPFHFTATVKARAAIKRGSRTIAGVSLEATLSGPGRWHAKGRAKIKLLFFSRTICFDESWGSGDGPPLPLVDVLGELLAALNDPENWAGALPAGGRSGATLREVVVDGILAHPLADLVVSQRSVPLGLQLERFGNARITGPSKFEIDAASIDGDAAPRTDVDALFALGNFRDLSDDDRLKRPSFEPMTAGVRIGAPGVTAGPEVVRVVDYETKELFQGATFDHGRYRPDFDQVKMTAELGAVARNGGSATGGPLFAGTFADAKVQVVERGFVLVDAATLRPLDDAAPVAQHRAEAALAALAVDDGSIRVVESHEVVT